MIRPAGAPWMAVALLTGLLALPSIGVAKPAAKHGAAKVAKVGKKGPAAPRAAPRKASPAPAAAAQPKERAATVSAPAPAADRGGDDGAGTTASPGAGGKVIKTKSYSFTSMDVEGKLKTPQLLYFLNRVKLELDMSAPDKRSFMKELQQSADDKNL